MKMTVHRRRPMVAVLMTGTILAATPSAAATLDWINFASGSWFDPSNWSGGAVPVAGDTAIVNNGGTAEAAGAVTPTATALDVGAGAGAVSGAVTTTGNLALGNGGDALRVGVATAAGADATGMLSVGGDVTGIAPAGAMGTFRIGQATGDGAQAEGTVSVTGDLSANAGLVGVLGAGDGQSASGALTVGGNLTGLAQVGAGAFSQNATATGSVTVTTGDLTTAAGVFIVGQTFGAGTVAEGSVDVQAGEIRTTGALWVIGNAQTGHATGEVGAAGVDATGAALNGLVVGNVSDGGTAEGTVQLGTGDLRVAGNALIGFADVTDGATALGTVTLGGTLTGEGDGRVLRVGLAIGQLSQTAPGEATGALSAEGATGFRTVDAGVAQGSAGLGLEADGTLTVGAGGLVNTNDPGGTLRIGVARALAVNSVLTGPGPVATGAVTVNGGDVEGYGNVDVGTVENAGMATGSLMLTGGTMTAAALDIGVVQPPSSALTLTDATAAATGTVTVTDGEIIVANPNPIFAGSTQIGFIRFFGQDFDQTAQGTLGLTRSRFESGIVFVGFGDGAEGTLTAVDSEIAVGDLGVGGGVADLVGTGQVTLTGSTLTATADPARGLTGSMFLRARDSSLTATDSDITLDGNLVVLGNNTSAGDEARMTMTGGTMSVGGSVLIGDFEPDSRGELSLTGTLATVGGNLTVGRSANFGTLFGEALLHLDGSLMDVTGALVLDLGGELSFGIGGLGRGVGGYGALLAGSADLRGGAAKVDFAGLMGPLTFDVAIFDLIALSNGLTGDFGLVSLLNVPTGYAASHAFAVEGDSDVWRVTLTRDVAPVPLPAGVWLLLSGLAAIGVQRRRRSR